MHSYVNNFSYIKTSFLNNNIYVFILIENKFNDAHIHIKGNIDNNKMERLNEAFKDRELAFMV